MSKVIVITGSTKGIGYGLAEEFLKRGQRVVGRTTTGRAGLAHRAVAELRAVGRHGCEHNATCLGGRQTLSGQNVTDV